jgi:hypothetical protein
MYEGLGISFAERGLHYRVARKDGEGYHDISIVSAVCKLEMYCTKNNK